MYRLFSTRHVIRGAIGRHGSPSNVKNISTKGQGQGIGAILIGLGLGSTAVAITGTAIYAALDPKFKEALMYNTPLSRIIKKPRSEEQVDNNTQTKLDSINNASDNKTESTESLSEEPAQQLTPIIGNEDAINEKDTEAQLEAISKSLIELQSALSMSCLAAVAAYSLASQVVRGLNEELEQHAKELHDGRAHQSAANDAVVLELLEKSRNSKDMVHSAEEAAVQTRNHINILKKALSDLCCTNIPLEDDLVEQIETSVSEAEMQLGEAENFLKQALSSTDSQEILQKRVALVTADLEEELGFSLVGSGSSEQRENFLRALAWQLLQYRKDVEHTVMTLEKHTKDLLSAQGIQGMEMRLQALVQAKETDLKHSLSEENYFQLSQLRKKLDHQLREKLHVQQWHSNEAKQIALHAKRAAFDLELDEQWNDAISLANENRQILIDELYRTLPNLLKIETAIKQSSDALILSTVSHSMVDALRTDPFPQLDWSHQIQPIEHLVDIMQDVSCDDADEFVHTVTKCIPHKALSRGVYTLNALKKRFYEVEQLARKVSLLKDRDNNSLFLYLMSYLRSLLLIHPVSVVSLSEKQNKPMQQGKLNNEEILDRAKYFVEQGDFRQAISYMNLLQGVAQFVSSGWSEEMLLHLEVMQAAQTLAAFSTFLVHQNIEQ